MVLNCSSGCFVIMLGTPVLDHVKSVLDHVKSV